MDDNEFKVETVKIVSADHDGGFAVINKADLTDADVLFDESKRKAPTIAKASKFGGKSDGHDD
jgi:hypothetical protein